MTEKSDEHEFIEEYECENCGETFIGGRNREKELCEVCIAEDSTNDDVDRK